MDEYRTARTVLIADVSVRCIPGRLRMDGWREDGLGQQRDDGGGCVTMRER